MTKKRPEQLFDMNRAWAARMTRHNPQFFAQLSEGQHPNFLWIGCSDSRIPANEIVGLEPGEMFVHRNIANVVSLSDNNCLAVIQYAVEVLEVENIVVAGHYGCGGIDAAMSTTDFGLIDTWLAHIKAVYRANYDELMAISDTKARAQRLCELNVMAQVRNVGKTAVVQSVWRSGRKLEVHGWIYALADGLLHDLGCGLSSVDQLHEAYRFETSA